MARTFITRYLVVLILLTSLSTGGYFTVEHLISIQEDNASLVTMSGNQLMLAQRIVTSSVGFFMANDDSTREVSARLLKGSVETMANAHALLTGNSGQLGKIFARSETLKKIYNNKPYQLDQQVQRFLQQARELLATNNEHARQSITDSILALSNGNLGEGLSFAMKQYQFEVAERIKTLETVRLAMLGAIYVLLALDGLIIFRPLLAMLGHSEEKLTAMRDKFEAQAMSDSLTRVRNRRAFASIIKRELATVSRYGGDLSLLFIDIDGFRDLNTTHGQDVCDRLLQEVAQLIENNVRQTDYVFRSGDAEFAVLTVSTPLDGALLLAEKISGLTRANTFHNRTQLTVRIGVAQRVEDENSDVLTTRTSAALEMARQSDNGVAEAPPGQITL